MSFFNTALKPDDSLIGEASAGPQVGFGEAFSKAFTETSTLQSVYGLEDAFRAEEQRALDQVYERTGQRLPPIAGTKYTREYLKLARNLNGSGTESAGDEEADRKMELYNRVRDDNPDLPSYTDMWGKVKLRANFEEQDNQQTAKRDSSVGGFVGSLAGGMAGSMTTNDPLNVASLAVGGFAKTVGGRIAAAVGLNSAVEAVNQFTGVKENRSLLGLDWSMGGALAQVAMAGAGAGVIRGGIEGWGAWRGRGAGPDVRPPGPEARPGPDVPPPDRGPAPTGTDLALNPEGRLPDADRGPTPDRGPTGTDLAPEGRGPSSDERAWRLHEATDEFVRDTDPAWARAPKDAAPDEGVARASYGAHAEHLDSMEARTSAFDSAAPIDDAANNLTRQVQETLRDVFSARAAEIDDRLARNVPHTPASLRPAYQEMAAKLREIAKDAEDGKIGMAEAFARFDRSHEAAGNVLKRFRDGLKQRRANIDEEAKVKEKARADEQRAKAAEAEVKRTEQARKDRAEAAAKKQDEFKKQREAEEKAKEDAAKAEAKAKEDAAKAKADGKPRTGLGTESMRAYREEMAAKDKARADEAKARPKAVKPEDEILDFGDGVSVRAGDKILDPVDGKMKTAREVHNAMKDDEALEDAMRNCTL